MNPTVRYLGIDPGVTGGWALITSEGSEKVSVFTDFKSFRPSIVPIQNIFAVLEQVSSMPRQGVKSMFTFGANYGGWQATLELLEISYQLVTPQKWQKAILGTVPKGESKVRALLFAQRKWPELNLKKKDHGIVDALCLALYARQLHVGTDASGGNDYHSGRVTKVSGTTGTGLSVAKKAVK